MSAIHSWSHIGGDGPGSRLCFQALNHLHFLSKGNLDRSTNYHFQRCTDAPFVTGKAQRGPRNRGQDLGNKVCALVLSLVSPASRGTCAEVLHLPRGTRVPRAEQRRQRPQFGRLCAEVPCSSAGHVQKRCALHCNSGWMEQATCRDAARSTASWSPEQHSCACPTGTPPPG